LMLVLFYQLIHMLCIKKKLSFRTVVESNRFQYDSISNGQYSAILEEAVRLTVLRVLFLTDNE